MSILTKWGFRTVRANLSRTVTAILAVVGFFALLTSISFTAAAATGGRITSLLDYWLAIVYGQYPSVSVIAYLFFCLALLTSTILYSSFSVTADESLQDYRILTAAGATARQIRRSLLLRAFALSGVGAAGGVAIGLVIARLMLDAEPFYKELTSVFLLRDRGTVLILTASLLLAPLLMACASARVFRRRRREKRPRISKHGLFRRSFTRRLFGAGGVLGNLNSRKNRRYRVIFTVSFAVCLAVLALVNNTLSFFTQLRITAQNFDLEIVGFDDTQDGSGWDVLNNVLLENAERFGVEETVSCVHPQSANSYYYLDDALLSVPGHGGRRSESDPTVSRHWSNFVFLDDDSFARLARENGADPDADGALYYDMFESGGRLIPYLKPQDVYPDFTLHFLPDSFVHASADDLDYTWKNFSTLSAFRQAYYTPDMLAGLSGDETAFRRKADAVSVAKTVRILGKVQSFPVEQDITPLTLIFPQQMYAAFSDFLYSSAARQIESAYIQYHLKLSDPATGIEAFRQMVFSDPRLSVFEHSLGFSYLHAQQDRYNDDELCCSLQITDLHGHKQQLQRMQTLVPKLRTLLLLTSVWILIVGILNTAYMNRMTRRREKAILESIGMSRRQQTGMLLYESVRYALFGAVLGWLGFAAAYMSVGRSINYVLSYAGLHESGGRVLTSLYDSGEVRATFLQELSQISASTWWIFAGGAALIFVLLIVTDKIIERRSGRDELIRILKDDSVFL